MASLTKMNELYPRLREVTSVCGGYFLLALFRIDLVCTCYFLT